MNKVYKVIWNSTLQCYTVVSELAKSHTKGASAKRVVGAAVLASLISFSSNAGAEDTSGVTLADDNTPIIIDEDKTFVNFDVQDKTVHYIINPDKVLTVDADIHVTAGQNTTTPPTPIQLN